MKNLALILALICLPPLGCRWQTARPHVVTSQVGADAAYRTLLDVLAEDKYQVLQQSGPERSVRVRAHVDEDEPSQPSFITAAVDPAGTIQLTLTGYLVKADGKVHARLTDEAEDLQEALERRFAKGQVTTTAAQSGPSPGAPPGPPAQPTATLAFASSSLPRGFYQAAPPGQGEGELTCLPVHVAENTELTLRLSNGEISDVMVALNNAVGICTNECRAPNGCPALGVGDRAKVERLAERMASGQVSTQVQILAKGSAIAEIDLGRHRFIKQQLSRAGAAPAGK